MAHLNLKGSVFLFTLYYTSCIQRNFSGDNIDLEAGILFQSQLRFLVRRVARRRVRTDLAFEGNPV